MHGKGVLYHKKHDYLFISTFAHSNISLTETIKIFANGSYYIGPLNHSLSPQGHGELIYEDGKCKYSGEFCDGVPHGKGKLAEGEKIFEGEFEMG